MVPPHIEFPMPREAGTGRFVASLPLRVGSVTRPVTNDASQGFNSCHARVRACHASLRTLILIPPSNRGANPPKSHGAPPYMIHSLYIVPPREQDPPEHLLTALHGVSPILPPHVDVHCDQARYIGKEADALIGGGTRYTTGNTSGEQDRQERWFSV